MNSICVVVRAHAYGTVWGEGGPGGHVALEGTLYSRVTCPGGRVTLVQSVRGDTVHWGTDSTPTTVFKHNQTFACDTVVFTCSYMYNILL